MENVCQKLNDYLNQNIFSYWNFCKNIILVAMAESGYPGILPTEDFLWKLSNREKFELYLSLKIEEMYFVFRSKS